MLPRTVVRMAEAAGGSVSRRDLVAMGYPSATIARWQAKGLFEDCGFGELRIPGSEPSSGQDLRIALNRAGAGARLGGAVNLGLRGVEGFTHAAAQQPVDHVIIPPGRRVRGVEFAVVRTPIPVEDHDWLDGLPAVTTARALIGAAATSRASRIRVAFDDARRKKLVTEAELRDRAVALGNAHGAAAMRRILDGGTLRMESEGERGLLTVFRSRDPLPEKQVWVCWHGKYYRLDFAYREGRLDLEYDGGGHDDRRERDADRDLALAELEIQTLRITKAMMRDPSGTRRRILAVREQRRSLGLPPIVPSPPPWSGRTLAG